MSFRQKNSNCDMKSYMCKILQMHKIMLSFPVGIRLVISLLSLSFKFVLLDAL